MAKQQAKPASILLADDHLMCREGLSYLLSNDYRFKVIGETSDGDETLEAAKKLKPNLVLLDSDIIESASSGLISMILEASPKTQILVLGKSKKIEAIRTAIQEGAKGYVYRKAEYAELIKAIETVLQGERYLSEEYFKAVITDLTTERATPTGIAKQEKLTKREKQVFKLLISGLKTAEIADKLNISDKTVHKHRDNILKKMEVTNLVQLTRLAYELGIEKVGA